MTIAKELPACPVETTLTLISDKWKVLILRDLLCGTMRFGELKKSVGHISQKVLTTQLREMEACGLLTRTVYPEGNTRSRTLGTASSPYSTLCGAGEATIRQKTAYKAVSISR